MKMLTDMIVRTIDKIYLFLFPIKSVEAKKEVKPRVKREGRTISGLLDQLDDSFELLKRLSPSSSQDQATVKKFGCYIPDNDRSADISRVENVKSYGTPTILCCALVTGEKEVDEEERSNMIVIAQKIKSSTWVKRRKGHTLYRTTYIHMIEKAKLELSFHVYVNNSTGEIIPIKEVQRSQRTFNSGGWRCPVTVSSLRVDYTDLRDADSEKQMDHSAKEYLVELFAAAFNFTMQRELNTNVIVTRGKLRAVFTVPENDWKYFFKNRVSVKVNGVTKRIFHAVASHVRHTKKGDQNVKTHYRGLRRFKWCGYDINIVMQGKHSVSQADFDIGGHDVDGMPKGFIPLASAADSLNDLYSGKHGAVA